MFHSAKYLYLAIFAAANLARAGAPTSTYTFSSTATFSPTVTLTPAITLPAPCLEWNSSYIGSNATGIALDGSGNIFVSGIASLSGLIKLDPNGNLLWAETHCNAGYGVAVDAAGYSYQAAIGLAGTTYFLVEKYDPAGAYVTSFTFNPGLNVLPQNIAADSGGNIYVTGGMNDGTNWQYLTVKFNPAGTAVWGKVFNPFPGSNTMAYGLAVDNATGTVYAGGTAGIVKITSAGTETYWGGVASTAVYGLAVDPSGNVYATGVTNAGPVYEYQTTKFNSSAAVQWNSVDTSPYFETAHGIALDSANNVYVTGFSGVTCSACSVGMCYKTAAYSSGGVMQWSLTYTAGAGNTDQGVALAVDASGDIFVTGTDSLTGAWLTKKYNPLCPATSTSTPTPTRTLTASPSSSASPTPSRTATRTPSFSSTASPTQSPSLTPSPLNTATLTRSPTPTASPSSTPTSSPGAAATATSTFSVTPALSPTATPSNTAVIASTATSTWTATPSQTLSSTPQPSGSPSFTGTYTPSASATATMTSTPTPAGNTASPSPSSTLSPSPSSSTTLTQTPSSPGTGTPTSTGTSSPTPASASSPAPGDGAPVLLDAQMVPNPIGASQASLSVEIRGQAQGVEIEVFSPAYLLIEKSRFDTGNRSNRISLPLDCAHWPNGPVFIKVRAFQGGNSSNKTIRAFVAK